MNSHTAEYRVFNSAWHRCNTTSHPDYHNYGGRGIRMLLNSYLDIIDLIGYRPPKHSIDRIDNDGNYEKGNIRWVTRSVQNANRRKYIQKRRKTKSREFLKGVPCKTRGIEHLIVSLRLSGISHFKISEKVGLSEEGVRRFLNRIKKDPQLSLFSSRSKKSE